MCSGQFFPQEAYAPVVLAEALHVRKDLIHAGLRQQWVAVKNRDERKIGLWVVERGALSRILKCPERKSLQVLTSGDPEPNQPSECPGAPSFPTGKQWNVAAWLPSGLHLNCLSGECVVPPTPSHLW